eukprot:98595_1
MSRMLSLLINGIFVHNRIFWKYQENQPFHKCHKKIHISFFFFFFLYIWNHTPHIPTIKIDHFPHMRLPEITLVSRQRLFCSRKRAAVCAGNIAMIHVNIISVITKIYISNTKECLVIEDGFCCGQNPSFGPLI